MADAGRLDKNHGFLRQIIQNQIDRDEYDRQLKERELDRRKSDQQTPSRATPSKSRRAPIYVPPHRRVAQTSADEVTPSAALSACAAERRDGVKRRVVVDGDEVPQDEHLLESYRHKARVRIARQLKQKEHQRTDSPPISTRKSSRTVVEKNDPLFTLQILDQNGETHTCVIRKNDSAARVAKKYCVSLGLNDAFAARLRKQIEARMASYNDRSADTNDSRNEISLSSGSDED